MFRTANKIEPKSFVSNLQLRQFARSQLCKIVRAQQQLFATSGTNCIYLYIIEFFKKSDNSQYNLILYFVIHCR